MAYDLLIKNGRIIDGSGRPAFNGDVGVARGRIVGAGTPRRPGAAGHRGGWARGGARVRRQPLPLRRPGPLGPALHLLVPPRRDHRDHRQLLAGARPGQGARARGSWPACCRTSRPSRWTCCEAGVPWTWETFPEYMRRDRPAARRQRRHARRPLRRPPLRDGRGVLGARRPRTPSSRPCGACCARPSMRARSGSRSPAT